MIALLFAAALAQAAPSPQDRWVVEARVEGDLDGDGRPDQVRVLKDPDGKRKLEVGFGTSDPRRYDRIIVNDKLLPQDNADNEQTFDKGGLAIKGRVLNLRIDQLRGNTTYSFRFQNGHFELIGYHSVGADAGMIEDDSYNFSTGRMLRSVSPIDVDPKKPRQFKFQSPVVTLDRIDGDYLPPQDYK
jgi:hypothetical protein